VALPDRIVLLSDRRPDEMLPALLGLGLDVKVEDLSLASTGPAVALGPELLIVDAAENPRHAHAILREIRRQETGTPILVVIERGELERLPWAELADELLFPGAPEAEIRVRLAMLRRRMGRGQGSTVRLGPLALDVDTYHVSVQGRTLDLTYKEFELLRFLAERPGRVFTRPALLREVWGYDFYGGTRTVDVHVRRLRSKLGPGREQLIETVRGVGYRAADLS
jgi:DNA-binding response OmpR family regulator